MKPIDITGHRFNLWTVVSRAENSRVGQAQWFCRCDCGAESVLTSVSVRSGHSKSCGCLKAALTAKRSLKHGHSIGGKLSPTYNTWVGMVARCTNKKHASFSNYGARGVTVHPRWLNFSTFLADMSEKPHGMSLDRFPNMNGNYEPANCRWATPTQQARNKRNNTPMTVDGRTMTIIEWAEHTGIHQATISWRLLHGWSNEDAIKTPVRSSARFR